MTTRTIVTTRPDVACAVCERRLLRGEHYEVFLAVGHQRTVCELCAPRVVHAGWTRESEQPPLKVAPARAGRGRSLIERLRQARGAVTGAPHAAAARAGQRPARESALQPYDFVADGAGAASTPVAGAGAASTPVAAARAQPDDPPAPIAGEGAPAGDAGPAAEPAAREQPSLLDTAVELFNASEHPRRVASVARSLGAPTVSVRSAEHAATVVRIVLAWELCWYRYEVDLDELDAAMRLTGQGAEPEELAPEERIANAAAEDSGALVRGDR